MGSASPVPSQLQIARIAQKPAALAPPPRFDMESASLAAKNGALRLPPGFRFHPTDEELVVQYLARKAHSHPLPASIIPDVDLTRYNPWDLPGGSSEERYFFTLREPKYPNGSRRANRAAAAGFWKATGKDKEVLGCNRAAVVGMKKVLVFYRGKPAASARTDWVMHEYRLASDRTAHNTGGPTRDWVLCRIFKKKRATNMDTEAAGNHNDDARVQNGVPYIDFMRQGNADVRPSLSASSSSESSCVTEHSKECCIGGEETSSSGIKSSA